MSQQSRNTLWIILLIIVAATSAIAQTGQPVDSTLRVLSWQSFDVPIDASAYLIRPGDKLSISFLGTTLRPLELIVDAEGQVIDPALGRFDLSKKTLADARKILTDPLMKCFRAREVVISVTGARPVSISVAGAVANPGTYRVFSSQTVGDVLVLAGGVLPSGSRRRIEFSGGDKTIPVDLERAFALGAQDADPPVYSGRSVFVPTQSSEVVSVQGEVCRPRVIELAPNDNLRLILALAGGVRPTADSSQIHYADETTPLALDAPVAAGRRIVVPPSARALAQFGLLVTGEVMKPGPLAFEPGSTLEAAIAAAGGFTDQANRDRITVFRRAEDGRVLPDGRTRYPLINLPSTVLQPFDSIVVPVTVGYVTVSGATMGSRFLPYLPDKPASFYIDAAGGIPKEAQQISVVRISRVTGMRLNIHPSDSVGDGDEIIVSWTEAGQ